MDRGAGDLGREGGAGLKNRRICVIRGGGFTMLAKARDEREALELFRAWNQKRGEVLEGKVDFVEKWPHSQLVGLNLK